MNLSAIDTRTKILLGSLLLICLILIGIAISLLWQAKPSVPIQESEQAKKTQQGFFSSLFSSTLEIVSYAPEKSTILAPEKVAQFTVVFSKPIRLDAITVSLAKTSIQTDQTSTVNITQVTSSSTKVLTITTKNPIIAYATYTLTITEKSTNKKLLSLTYSSDTISPTPLVTNNLQLRQYLPYETGTYALSYLEKRNIYVFNFLFNPDDPTDIQVQFEHAKQNALLFIKSKGIDPNSVVIDWRFH